MIWFWIIYVVIGLCYFASGDIQANLLKVKKPWHPLKWYTLMLFFIVVSWPVWFYWWLTKEKE